jgi:Predicted pyridoxal phosphate-dependent enzyme apparently involved in regulation of cell wall biogenesis
MIYRCDVVTQYANYKKEIQQSMERVLRSGRYILGDENRLFEKEFAAYCEAGFAVAVANGTEALFLAQRGLGVGPGDEVITSPFSPIPTVSAIIMAGARPVFVDINPDDFLINPDILEKCINKRTKAIMPIHLFGNVVDMPRLLKISQKYGIRLIEDACQAHGSLYNGRMAGTIGDAGCFSFYPTKNLGGYGDGGMIVTNNAGLAKKLYMLRDYGRDGLFTTAMFGVNSRLDEIQAAILRVKLKHLDSLNAMRRELAHTYSVLLRGVPVQLPVENILVTHNYHVFVIRCTKGRDKLRSYLEKNGIQTNIYYPISMHLQKACRYLEYKRGDFPVSEKACTEVLAIPMYPELGARKVKIICDRIKQFYKARDY